jgi:hypothetical protein
LSWNGCGTRIGPLDLLQFRDCRFHCGALPTDQRLLEFAEGGMVLADVFVPRQQALRILDAARSLRPRWLGCRRGCLWFFIRHSC